MQSLGNSMAEARGKLKSGEAVSLEALEARVEALCQDAENLPREDHGNLQESLSDLLEEIERLNDAIRISMAELTAQISDAPD
jgi:hypothetical protein